MFDEHLSEAARRQVEVVLLVRPGSASPCRHVFTAVLGCDFERSTRLSATSTLAPHRCRRTALPRHRALRGMPVTISGAIERPRAVGDPSIRCLCMLVLSSTFLCLFHAHVPRLPTHHRNDPFHNLNCRSRPPRFGSKNSPILIDHEDTTRSALRCLLEANSLDQGCRRIT